MARQILRIEVMTDEERGFTLSVGVISGGTFVNTVPIECTAQVLAVMQTQETFDEVCERMLGLETGLAKGRLVQELIRQPELHRLVSDAVADG